MNIRAARGELARYFRDVVMAYEGDECLIWPYVTDSHGYARMSVDRKSREVSRLVCAETHGEPPAPRFDAAHSCGNGHRGCVTKRHLSWKTRKQNLADRVEHGTAPRGIRNPQSKLTERNVRDIRAMRLSRSRTALAEQFGVTVKAICDIYRGRTWAWLE